MVSSAARDPFDSMIQREMTITGNIELGKTGEAFAQDCALQRGYQVLGSNIRTPYGEIDLVLRKEDLLVFAEVKTRTSYRYGFPEQAVNKSKLEHMIQSAQHYLTEEKMDCGWRLDVIAVLYDAHNQTAKDILWIENVTADE